MTDPSQDASRPDALVRADAAQGAPLNTASAPPSPAPPYPPDFDEGEGGGLDLSRLPAILWRQKWLVAASLVAGLAVAYVAARAVEPRFTVQALLQVGEPMAQQQGVTAIQTGPRFGPLSWANLMRSNAVLDRVVDGERLYITPQAPASRTQFSRTEVVGEIRPGRYRVVVSAQGDRVQLVRGEDEIVESHALPFLTLGPAPQPTLEDQPASASGDIEAAEGGAPLGETVGVRLNLAPETLAAGVVLPFELQSRRDASRWLAGNLMVQPSQSAFMTLMIQGSDPYFAARLINAVTDSFLQEAVEISRAQSDQLSRTLEEQLASARAALLEAEAALEAFETRNALLPQASLGGSTEVSAEFLDLQLRSEEVERDLAALDRALQRIASSGEADVQALEAIPAARASSELSAALEEVAQLRAEVRSLLLRYTEDHPTVRELRQDLSDLETRTIPGLVLPVRGRLEAEASELGQRTAGRAEDLRGLPTRALTQGRLRRQLAQAEALYEDVNRRYSSARLAALSATPDVQVVDRAEPPSRPDGDRRLTLALGILFAFTGAGGVGAILLDRRDRRIRSPTDVETRLGLTILGALPHLGSGRRAAEARGREQAVEAFRTIRLGLLYAYGSAGPTILTVSSPAPGDGKSFVTSNLALSFAELGKRTVVIDGDTRKGVQHRLLDVERRPGLTDYLVGQESLDACLRPTHHPNLFVLPLGSRAQGSPELLVGRRMQDLLASLKSDFDVILVDSPPLGAAADPIMLGSLTGSMVIVLRNAQTDSDQAAAVLQNLRRYPVRVLGAILNDVPSSGAYRYYSYAAGYAVEDEEAEITTAPELIAAGNRSD